MLRQTYHAPYCQDRARFFVAVFLIVLSPCAAFAQLGKVDYSHARAKIDPLRGNVYLLQTHAGAKGDDISNIGVVVAPEGYLLVDHPEAAAGPVIRTALDDFAKRPVKFLLNTHWHYDHVGGNELYGPNAVIVAHENVRKRLSTKQTPWWSPTPIGPYPQRAWPRVTYGDSMTIHFGGEDVELDHYADGHTDGDTIVYFRHTNVVQLGDLFHGKGSLSAGIDLEGIARSLTAVRDRINDQTIVITGHGEKLSNRRDLAEYIDLLNATIAQVKTGISAGRSLKEIQDEGIPEKWKSWVQVDPDFPPAMWIQLIYTSLTAKNPDQ